MPLASSDGSSSSSVPRTRRSRLPTRWASPLGASPSRWSSPSTGANRVDEAKLTLLAGGPARRADADTVKRVTGFAIGGVAPIAHEMPLEIFIDEDLLRLELIYAAAGVPECVFPVSPAELVRATRGRVADVKEQGKPAQGETR
jgi:hypothetical protein